MKPQSKILTPTLLGFSALGAYFAVLFAGGLINGAKASVIAPKFIIYFHPLTYALIWLTAAVILVAYGSISKPMVYRFTWLSALCYALRTAVSGGSYYLTFAMCGLMAVMTYACGRALRAESAAVKQAKAPAKKSMTPAAAKVAVGAAALLAGGGILFLLLSAYLTYTASPSMSTGVYIQLMESLRRGFSFETTLEFGETVSHLAAHISPIFLVYLPFYALIPSPVTLLVLQTAAVCSAVIPLWKIARRHGLSPALSAVLCGLLCCFPAVWGGAAGSFHEYALLLPLLLWLIWALESHRRVLIWILSALILCLRETCAIHLFTVGLYWLIRHRKADAEDPASKSRRTHALLLMAVSAVYLVTALAVLTYAGKGTLITRFENVTGIYATDFGTFLRALIYNPAIALYEMLTEAKLHYVLCMLLPLGLLPLLSRQKAGLVFLFPFLLLNLLADFPLHFGLDYPYSFGVAAFGLYLAVIALETLQAKAPRLGKGLIAFAVCCTLLIGGLRLATFAPYAAYPFTGRADVQAMDDLLETVEDTASVSASGYLIPKLASREFIYSLSHGVTTDYVVLDLREDWANPAEADYTVAYFEELGYTVAASADGVGVVMKKS